MKNVHATLTSILLLQAAHAQIKEGTISYEQTADLHRRIPEENQQLRSMVPQFRTTKFELLFADNQSLYKAVEEEPDMTEQNNGGIVLRMGGGAENEYYRNYSSHKSIELRELMDELYLVEDSVRSIAWKLEEGETKVILGYTCKKATGKTARGNDVVAWYCEDIPIAAGPEQFNGLPGLILLVDINKGEIIYVAKVIDKKIDRKKLKAPAKGKKIAPAEFLAKQNELMGNGPVRIVTN